jgi:hypothetical protein
MKKIDPFVKRIELFSAVLGFTVIGLVVLSAIIQLLDVFFNIK